MRLWALLAAALLTSLVLAGCSDDGEGGGATSTSSSSSAAPTSTSASTSSSASRSSSSSTSTSSGPAPNKAPTGSIAASASTGGAPLAVNFTLTGSDPDGDTVVWDLAFGDGATEEGTTLPATVAHTYSAAGNYTASFTLTDGTSPTTYNVTISVAAGAGGAPEGLSFAGSVQVFCVLCTDVVGAQAEAGFPLPVTPIPSPGWAAGEQGVDTIWVEIPAGLAGRPFEAASSNADVAVLAATTCDPSAVVGLQLFDDGSTPEPGTVPDGTGCMILWEYFDPTAAPGAADLTLVIS